MTTMTNTLNASEIASLHSAFDNTAFAVRRKDIIEVGEKLGFSYSKVRKTLDTYFTKGGRGEWIFPTGATLTVNEPAPKRVAKAPAAPAPAPAAPAPAAPAPSVIQNIGVASVCDDEIFIPEVDPTFVAWGEHSTVMKVLKANRFFPIYISGMSGNGKTFMVEQACAKAKREYVRVQISPETDEDDLLGGFRLINGETVYQKGPVIKAMERGCVLLIDEVDRATNKIMCLQGICEGKPVLIKKTGQVVKPAPGFTVIATANTKGRGSDDGRYSAATIIDDAFLERFKIAIDQAWPTAAIETRILNNHAAKFGVEDETFVSKLIAWSNVIRKTFEDDAIDDVISTRRLCHIIEAHSIFDDRMIAIEKCTNRFDEDTKTSFRDLYTKIDEEVLPQPEAVEPTAEQSKSVPF
jgi:MoxR-like ATPase